MGSSYQNGKGEDRGEQRSAKATWPPRKRGVTGANMDDSNYELKTEGEGEEKGGGWVEMLETGGKKMASWGTKLEANPSTSTSQIKKVPSYKTNSDSVPVSCS